MAAGGGAGGSGEWVVRQRRAAMLAPIESSEAFLVAYQDLRGRLFTAVEQEIAWAASVWMAAYNAREEALPATPRCAGDALRAQAAERLRRANA